MAASAARNSSGYRTNGNLAYQRAQTPVRQPVRTPEQRPRIRTRERPYVRPRAVVREAGHVSIFAVFGFAAVGALAILFLLSCVQLMTTADRTVKLRQELTQLQDENVRLLAEYELAYDLKAIEHAMLSTGTMVKPRGGQIVVLDLSAPDNVVVFDDGADDGLLDGFLNHARSLISGAAE